MQRDTHQRTCSSQEFDPPEATANARDPKPVPARRYGAIESHVVIWRHSSMTLAVQ